LGSYDRIFGTVTMDSGKLKSSRDVLLFMHITKTAGGSLKEALKTSQGSDECLFFNVSDMLPVVQEKHKLVFGHFPFGIHHNLSIAPSYACVLRHPVVRTISHYHHLYNNEKGPVGDKIRAGGEDINDFFEKSYHWEFENFFSKIISGEKKLDSIGENPNSEAMYQQSCNNLEKSFKFIGIFEYLDLTVLLLSEKFGISIDKIPKINIGSYKFDKVSISTLQRISELNHYDLILYRDMVNRFLNNFKDSYYNTSITSEA